MSHRALFTLIPTLLACQCSLMGAHYGYIEPLNGTIGICPKQSRVIREILVNEGDEVEAGQVLAVLEHSKEQAEYEVVKAEVEVARADLAITEDSLTRHEELYEQEVISEYQVTQSKLKRNRCLAAYNVALKELKLAEVGLEDFHIKAPVAGKLYKLQARIGERTTAGDAKSIIIGDQKLGARVWVNPEKVQNLESKEAVVIRLAHNESTQVTGRIVGRSQLLQRKNPAAPETDTEERFVELVVELDDDLEEAEIGALVTAHV